MSGLRPYPEWQPRVFSRPRGRPDVPEHKRLASSEISPESRKLAAHMLRAPLSACSFPDSTKSAADLRKFLMQTLERNIDKKLVTRVMLEKITP